MKSSALLLLFVGAILTCQGQDLRKVESTSIDQQQVAIAREFAETFYARYNEDSVYIMTEGVTPELKNALNPTFQRNLNHNTQEQFGKYEGLQFVEEWIQSNYGIFRFKADFEKTQKKLEIRVVLNSSNDVAGFFLRTWSDMMY